MPFTVDPASIMISFTNIAAARPDIDLTVDPAICHLTSGYSVATGTISRHAWTVTGTANVSGADPAGDDDFGFIQFAEQSSLEIEYSGSKKVLGSVALSPAQRPVWPARTDPAVAATTLLDSNGQLGIRPWTAGPPRFTLVSGQVTCVTGDHPAARLGWIIQNRKTSADNFLMFVKDTREFWTVFTKKERNRTPSNEYLAHCHWSLIYMFRFVWRNRRPVKIANSSKIQFDSTMTKGPPTDPDVQILLNEANQGGPDYNEVAHRAIQDSALGQLPNRRDDSEWFLSTPRDFFK